AGREQSNSRRPFSVRISSPPLAETTVARARRDTRLCRITRFRRNDRAGPPRRLRIASGHTPKGPVGGRTRALRAQTVCGVAGQQLDAAVARRRQGNARRTTVVVAVRFHSL